ncbi:MAG: translocation/assembly module TamB domain-containing protein [Burkholderiales bacterium]|nr:translocation/assembly module TamB domain-containing protein [Burkholderiales bacterium]
MKRQVLRVARWMVRVLVGLGLLLALAAAGAWWWAGQEGSLAWALQRLGPRLALQGEEVHGSLRGGWRIGRLAWERDGLRVEVRDLRLEWQPLALLQRRLLLEQVQAARLQVVDARPPGGGPPPEPASLGLPWRLEVESLKLGAFAYEGGMRLEGGPVEARYAFDGWHHRLELQRLELAGGSYRGEADLLASAPLTLDLRLQGRLAAPVPGIARPVPLAFELRARGPARAIEASARLRAQAPGAQVRGGPSAQVTARITPFERVPLAQAHVEMQYFDAAWFWPRAPHTLLAGSADVQPVPGAGVRWQADLRNGAAGPWDQGRLPLDALRAAGEWRDGAMLLESLAAQAAGGRIEGRGHWQGRGWNFTGRVADVDPAQAHTRLPDQPLAGSLRLSGEGRGVAFEVALQSAARRGGAPARPRLRELLARGRWSGDALSLAQLRVDAGDALLEAQGEWQPRAQAGSGSAQVRAPGLRAQVQGALARDHGQGHADVTLDDLAQAQQWLARWPSLAAALAAPGLRGRAQAQLAWQGGWRDPSVQARIGLQDLARPSDQPQPWVVREATLQLNGPLRDATVELRGQAVEGARSLDLAARGSVAMAPGDAAHWRGQVASLLLQLRDPDRYPGPWQLRLRRAVPWQAAAGRFELGAGEAVLESPALPGGVPPAEAALAWDPLHRQQGQLTGAGRVRGVPLAWLGLLGEQAGAAALAGDLTFDGQWGLQWGTEPRFDVSLARARGDVHVLAEGPDGTTARVSAGVRAASASLVGQGGQLELRLLWDSERAGHAEGLLRSRLERAADGRWRWPEDAPLEGRLQAQLPRIGVWSVLAPPGWRLRGSLAADIRIAGTRERPALSGPLRADDLALRSVVDGIELRGGRLRAQLEDQGLRVDEFLLHGSPGDGSDGGVLRASGVGRWTPQGPAFEARATLSQLRASIRGDRQLTVSGTVSAQMDGGGTRIAGDLRVDRARIRIPDQAPPRLGADVVVRNAPGLPATDAQRHPAPSETEATGRLTLRLGFDLGPDFRVSGRGLDARLAGRLEVRNAADGSPLLTGQIRTEDGTFAAYGQRLKIERGELRFTGPADNPALDILAVRPNMVEKVGVQVTGRALAPHVALWSEAGLSEAETLSWVVLGRSSAGSGAETALLQRAAAAMLAGRHGTGRGVAGSLGLDDLSVTPDSTSGAVVRVGKRFADNLYAAYERSLSGTMGTLFLFYDVSRRVTVRAEAGERAGLDLILTFHFGEPQTK